MIPSLTDIELERILAAAAASGARTAGYVLLRLPHEVTDLFSEWLRAHHPDRAEHVLSLVRQSRDGKLYDPTFGKRMRGEGVFADMLAQRFALTVRRLGLNASRTDLRTDLFRLPPRAGDQLNLF